MTIHPSKCQKILFITNYQTKGKGRRGRQWINSDLMISWSYSLTKAPQTITTSLMGIALYTALKNTWDCDFKIKPPNDIYINNKKIAGLLIEVISKGNLHQLIIGVGMNVFTNPSAFTNLQKNLKIKITQKQWHYFLNQWHKQIHIKIKLCTKLTLKLEDQKILNTSKLNF